MKVTTVSANIRFSKEIAGAWKVIELGAEASLDPKDTWQAAQHQLYGELSQQLHKMWANGKTAQNGAQSHTKAPQAPEPPQPPEPPAHVCQGHQTPFKRYSQGESVWWSHKTADGKWCREK